MFGVLNLLVPVQIKVGHEPIVLERSTIPLVPIKTIPINGFNTLERIHTEFCRAQSDDGAQTLMSFVDGPIFTAAISLPLDPEIGEWAGDMGIGNLC
jgi:hypothetical protein